MKYFRGLVVCSPIVLAASLVSCGGPIVEEPRQAFDYPAPRYPRFAVSPTSEQLLEAARGAVRQNYGMGALGRARRGTTVHIFLPEGQDREVWEAIRNAWAELGVTAVAVWPWEVRGLPEAEYRALSRPTYVQADEGWKEWGHFNPDFIAAFPKDVQEQFYPIAISNGNTHFWLPYLQPYLDKHPEIKYVWRSAGGSFFSWNPLVRPADHKKFMGNWLYRNKVELTNKSSQYPPAVWNLVEDQIVNLVDKTSEGSYKDAEGSDLHWVVTPEQALEWRGFVDLVNNHLFSYPHAWRAERMSGVIAGTANHTGYFPHMKVHLTERGKVARVEGGGRNGDLFRTLLQTPAMRDVKFASAPDKGYWWIVPDGLATNPKKVRAYDPLVNGEPGFPNLSERERACVQHLSFASPAGKEYVLDKEKLATELKNNRYTSVYSIQGDDVKLALDRKLPIGHTAHIHNYFVTLKYRMRDTGQWMTICDKGMTKAFDNPEVQALAAKYGNPEQIFAYDWIPDIPGINSPGKIEEFNSNPWAVMKRTWEKIKNGSYDHYVEDYTIAAPAAAGQQR